MLIDTYLHNVGLSVGGQDERQQWQSVGSNFIPRVLLNKQKKYSIHT